MHPVRRVGQALHTVEVGHIVALGLGEVGAEVGIALLERRRERRGVRVVFAPRHTASPQALRMEPKQFNVRMPLFAHGEFAELRQALRAVGSKPTDGDLVAALIYAALNDVAATKTAVEAWVAHELAVEEDKS